MFAAIYLTRLVYFFIICSIKLFLTYNKCSLQNQQGYISSISSKSSINSVSVNRETREKTIKRINKTNKQANRQTPKKCVRGLIVTQEYAHFASPKCYNDEIICCPRVLRSYCTCQMVAAHIRFPCC